MRQHFPLNRILIQNIHALLSLFFIISSTKTQKYEKCQTNACLD
jgi:hypothetical protein